jgi:phosphate/sulfate permease
MRSELRWTVGCLVGAAAVVGALILVLLVTLALQPPEWVQVVVGVGLVAGGAALAWLVASALGQSRARRRSHSD